MCPSWRLSNSSCTAVTCGGDDNVGSVVDAREDISIDMKLDALGEGEITCGCGSGSNCRVGVELGADFGVTVGCCSCVAAETGVSVLLATDADFGACAGNGYAATAGTVAVTAAVVADDGLDKTDETFGATGVDFVVVVAAVAAVAISANVDDRADTKLRAAEGGGVISNSSIWLSDTVCIRPDKYAAIDRGCSHFFGRCLCCC